MLLALDGETPWRTAATFLEAAASVEVSAHRVFFGVRPLDGDEPGAVAAFLPQDRGLTATLLLRDAEGPLRLEAVLAEKAEWADASGLGAIVADSARAGREVIVRLDVAAEVPFSFVPESLDAAARGGASHLEFLGRPKSDTALPRRTDGTADSSSGSLRLASGFRVSVRGARLPAQAPPLPAPARVRGAYAGFMRPAPELFEELTEVADAVRAAPDAPEAPDEEFLGDPRFLSDSPFEGPSTGGMIGIGGGGGPFVGRRSRPRNPKFDVRAQEAVYPALEWLKNHQSPDGRWDADGFDAQCKLGKCSGPGESVHDPGVTGLALLCFLGAGETHQSGSYKDTVKAGLRHLREVQDEEGCFGPRTSQHFQYDHMCASLAMIETYGLTQSILFKNSAQRGVNLIHRSQNPYLAWRYGVRDGDNDSSVTGWAVMALESAVLSGLEVDKGAFVGAVAWIDMMTDPDTGRVGYQDRGGPPARTTAMQEKFPASEAEALTAVGVLARIFRLASAGAGATEKDEFFVMGSERLLQKPPRWDPEAGTIDYYSWYWGGLATFQVGGEPWKTWDAALRSASMDHQRVEAGTDERGSWDPVDPWSPEGGRVYATALNRLCMEVAYRYPRVLRTK